MNTFNRILAVLALGLLVFCAVLNAVGVWAVPLIPQATREQAATSLATLVTSAAVTPQIQAITTIVALLVVMGAFILLFWEFRLSGNAPSLPVAKAADGGVTRISSEAVIQRLVHSLGRIDAVVEAHPRVRRRGDGVEVHLDVRTSPEIDVPMKDNEIKQVARNVIEEQLGLNLKKLTVVVNHAPFPDNDMM